VHQLGSVYKMSSDICDSSVHDGCFSPLNDAKTFPYHIMIQLPTSKTLYKQLIALSISGKLTIKKKDHHVRLRLAKPPTSSLRHW